MIWYIVIANRQRWIVWGIDEVYDALNWHPCADRNTFHMWISVVSAPLLRESTEPYRLPGIVVAPFVVKTNLSPSVLKILFCRCLFTTLCSGPMTFIFLTQASRYHPCSSLISHLELKFHSILFLVHTWFNPSGQLNFHMDFSVSLLVNLYNRIKLRL